MTLLLVMVMVIISHTIYLGILYYNQSQSQRLINQRAFYEGRIQRLVAQTTMDEIEQQGRWQLEIKIKQAMDEQFNQLKSKIENAHWSNPEPFFYVALLEEGYITVDMNVYIHEYWQDGFWQWLVPKGYLTHRSHQKIEREDLVSQRSLEIEGYQLENEVIERYFNRLYYRTTDLINIPFVNGNLQIMTNERKQQREVLSFISIPQFTSRKVEPIADFYFLIETKVRWYTKDKDSDNDFSEI